ncbi:MAG: chemotaxis protein CheC [Candidatus Helarchaeota archaeon]
MNKSRKRVKSNRDNLTLTPEQLDTLMELGNIGTGNAVTALSKLLNKKIEMSLTDVSIIPFWKILEEFEGPETQVFGIYSDINGFANLSILQFFTKKSTIEMMNNLLHKDRIISEKVTSLKDLDEFSISTITEIGNILAAHFANSLASLMKTVLIPEVPVVALDMIATILNSLVAKYSFISDYLIITKTNMSIEEFHLEGSICFIPDLKTLETLFKAINVESNLNSNYK